MSNPGMYLTDDGKEILRKGLIGKEIKFSKVAFGAGDFDYTTESVADMTALKDWRMDLPIVDKVIDGGMVKIVAALKNFDLADGFPAKEIGVFAFDPDTGAEKLYAYRNAGDEYNFIPGGGGVVKKDIQFGYWVEIRDAETVTFVIDYSFSHVLKSEFEEHLNSENPHLNSPSLQDEVDVTDNFWATDFDNHLHKISVEHAKKVLLDDLLKKLSHETKKLEELNNFVAVKNSIGLVEPNILMIENFNPATLLDDTKVQITSCARGGNILSAKSLEGVKVGAEYFLSDGVSGELVTIENITISSSTVLINNANFVLTLANNLANSYNLDETFLYRTFQAEPLQSRTWHAHAFTGNAANVSREVALDFSTGNLAAFTVVGDGMFKNNFFSL